MANYPIGMPYDDIKVFDYSIYDTTSVRNNYVPTGLTVFQPIISEKGIGKDGELVYITERSQLDGYGTPNMKKYGLSHYLADNVLKAGANLLTCRLVANDSKPASLLVYARYTKSAKNDKISNLYNTDADGNLILSNISDNSNSTMLLKVYADEFDDTGSYLTIYDIYNKKYKYNKEYYCNYMGCRCKFIIQYYSPHIIIYNGEDYANSTYYTYATEVTSDTSVSIEYAHFENQYDWIDWLHENDIDEYNKVIGVIIKEDNGINRPLINELEDEGEYIIPLMVFRSKANGKFGNNISIKLYNDLLMDAYANSADAPNRFYTIEVFDNNTRVQDTVTFSFDDYIYNNTAMDYTSIFEKSDVLELELFPQFFEFREHIATRMNQNVESEDYKLDEENIDVLFGVDHRGIKYTNIVDTLGNVIYENTYIPMYAEVLFGGKYKFGGGSDGSFDNIKYIDENDPTKIIEHCDYDYNKGDQDPFAPYFVKAFNGEISDLIFDEVRTPFRMIFSPSLNNDVNDAIHALVNERKTTAAFYGFPTNSKTYLTNRKHKVEHYPGYVTYKEYFISESAEVRDIHTHKRMRMPSVFFNSYAIPYHWRTSKGKQFAGSDFYWKEHINGTLLPRTVERQEYINNHNNGLNTMTENGKGIANAYEQITSQTPIVNSMLSELSYSICLLEMSYIALEYARERRWTDIDDENIEEYKNELGRRFNERVGSWYKSCEIEVTQASTTGAGRNRLLCKIYVIFKNINKGVTYEFYVI